MVSFGGFDFGCRSAHEQNDAKVYAVRGNCDYFGGSAQRYESEAVVEPWAEQES